MKRKLFLSVWILCMNCCVTFAVEPTTPNASKEAKALLNYLYSVNGKQTLSGQMWAPFGNMDEISLVYEITGRYPAIRGQDLISESENSNEIKLAIEWWKKGGIPTVMWHWGAPSIGEGYENSKKTIDIARCFEEGTPENLAMWSDLKRVADHLTVLRDNNVPVLWRPMHEYDGGWFWYGKGTGEQFIRLWTTMYDYFTKERKLNNLIWVLCHCGTPKVDWDPKGYYDLAGADNYGKGIQRDMYLRVQAIHGTDRPIPYHECGTIPDPDDSFAKNGAPWSWWMLWHTSFVTKYDRAELKRIYNHKKVITLDELPDIMKKFGGK